VPHGGGRVRSCLSLKGRLKKGFRRPLYVVHMMTLCLGKANRSCGLLEWAKPCRLKKGFRRHLCFMRMIMLQKTQRAHLRYCAKKPVGFLQIQPALSV
jgi:hypothetical protein